MQRQRAQSQTPAVTAAETQSATSGVTTAHSNQDTAQDLGLSSSEAGVGGGGPEAAESTVPAVTPPFVVLARGAAATDDEVLGWQLIVESHLSGWNMTFNASSVVLGDIGTDTCEPVIALRWSSAWGPVPSMLDMPSNLSPLEARVAVAVVSASDGWGELESGVQGQLTALLGGETNTLSAAARTAAQTYVGDAGWGSQPAEAQAEILRELITSDTARPALVDEPHPAIEPAAHTLTGPVLEADHAFRGVTADADVWTVTMTEGGQTVTIYAPHAPDAANGHHYTVDQAVHALVRLPAASRAVVTSITLNAARNPDDAFWAVEYNDPNFESFMTAGAGGDITIYPSQGSPQSQTYTDDTMVHETGHTWSKQQWGEDTTSDAWRPWRDAMASDGVSVSNYATASVDEDVAETITIYNTSKGTPQFAEYQAMVPARFAILATHF
jgi:hypothetical protein